MLSLFSVILLSFSIMLLSIIVLSSPLEIAICLASDSWPHTDARYGFHLEEWE